MEKSLSSTPILLVVFNRPDTTQRVFDAIARIRPPKLYIAIDAPRKGNNSDVAKRKQVKDIVSNIPWECEVKYKEPEENLGVDTSVSTAVDWLFEHEETGIIFEDDCVPNESFFLYCEELLERYKDDKRVMCISGDNFQNGIQRGDASYYFSRHTHIWGWATWRRAWKLWHTDYDEAFQIFKREKRITSLIRDRATQNYWMDIFQRIYTKEIDNWDYKWTFVCWYYKGLTCIPNVNLVSNIGYGSNATHTFDPDSRLANIPTHSLPFPLRHPCEIRASQQADIYTDSYVFQTHRVFKILLKKILRTIGILPSVRKIYNNVMSTVRS